MERKRLAILAVLLLCGACKSTSTSSTPKNPPTIVYFLASPDTIEKGDSSTLSWSIMNAATASIDNNIGSIATEGTRTVNPTTTTKYTLTAGNNDGSVTASASITVKEVAVMVLDGNPAQTEDGLDRPMFTGYVKNTGTVTGYNCGIDFHVYSDANHTTIIDTATGFPADLGDIGPGQRAYFEATFFHLASWSPVRSWDYKITWLNRTTAGRMEPMFTVGRGF